jgi:preprotein translocase subunit SecG
MSHPSCYGSYSDFLYCSLSKSKIAMESNNIDEVLGVVKKEKEKSPNLLRDERNLRIIANIILIVGIIASLILLFTIVVISSQQNYYSSEGYVIGSESGKIFSATGLATTLATLLVSVTLWAFFRVISNISISLKMIKEKPQL